jgi:hypothetical protein
MAHRAKHRRANWPLEREAKALAREEKHVREKPPPSRRELPVSIFLRQPVFG